MDPELYAKRQRDEQLSNEQQDAHSAQLESRLKDVHTCIPGIIVSFDPGNQWAEVQPAIKTIFTTSGAVDLPLCVDVPVMFPSGNRFFITWPVFPGDECLLFFSQRCIDLWALEGETQEPDDYRTHDMSDGIAFVGLNSLPLVIEDFQMDGIDIRSPLRTSYVKVKEDTIEVHASVLVDVKAPDIVATATNKIKMTAPIIELNGEVRHTGNYVQVGGTSTHDGVNVGKTHKHLNVTIGTDKSGLPTT